MKKLSEENLRDVTGGLIVDDGRNGKYWLIRQNGTVISPVPSLEKAEEFAKAYGESTRVLTPEAYEKTFGRPLVW